MLSFIPFSHKGAGPYKDLHGLFKFVCDSKQKYNLKDCKVAGIYYDDPETIVLPRYAVGFLVESKQMAQMNAVKNSLSKDYQFLEIKKTRTICATFPIRAGFLSYALSAMKVYPAFKKRLQVRLQSGVMEIYHGNFIATHFPVEHFDLFLPRE